MVLTSHYLLPNLINLFNRDLSNELSTKTTLRKPGVSSKSPCYGVRKPTDLQSPAFHAFKKGHIWVKLIEEVTQNFALVWWLIFEVTVNYLEKRTFSEAILTISTVYNIDTT